MLLINKNSNNTLVLTLTEKSMLSSPTYLFRFTSDLTRESVLFIASNLSTQTQRFDKFLITETSGTTNLTSGVINLSPTGFWKYEIYEQTSTSNLVVNSSCLLVETGKAKVVGTNTTHATYTTPTRKYKGYGSGAS